MIGIDPRRGFIFHPAAIERALERYRLIRLISKCITRGIYLGIIITFIITFVSERSAIRR